MKKIINHLQALFLLLFSLAIPIVASLNCLFIAKVQQWGEPAEGVLVIVVFLSSFAYALWRMLESMGDLMSCYCRLCADTAPTKT